MYMQGETIAKESNHVRLSKEEKDQWGIPLLITSVDYDDNDDKMLKDFLEQGKAMMEAAVSVGLSSSTARELLLQTVKVSAIMLEESGAHPAVLKQQVTSPGGTTIAALRQLEEGGIRRAFFNAVEAARNRSIELG